MGVTRLRELLARALRDQDPEADPSFAAPNPAFNELTAYADFEELLVASEYLRLGPTGERQLHARLLADSNMSPERRLAEVLRVLEDESDPTVIRWLVFGLRNAASPTALGLLRELANHESPEVRFPVPDALSASAETFEAIADVLLELSRDEDPDVRWSAVFELGAWWTEIKDPRIRDRLREVQESDPSYKVRRAAAEGLDPNEAT